MRKADFANRIRTAVLITDDLYPIEFALESSDNTPHGLVLKGQILIPHKRKSAAFAVLVEKEWDDNDAGMAFIGFLRQTKASVEKALKAGVLDEPDTDAPRLLLPGDDVPPPNPGQNGHVNRLKLSE